MITFLTSTKKPSNAVMVGANVQNDTLLTKGVSKFLNTRNTKSVFRALLFLLLFSTLVANSQNKIRKATRQICCDGSGDPITMDVIEHSSDDGATWSVIQANYDQADGDCEYELTCTVNNTATMADKATTYPNTVTMSPSASGSGAWVFAKVSGNCTVNASSGVVRPTNGVGTCVVSAYREADATYCQSNTIQADVTLSRGTELCNITGVATMTESTSKDYNVTTSHDGVQTWGRTGEIASVDGNGLATASGTCGAGTVTMSIAQSDKYRTTSCEIDVTVDACCASNTATMADKATTYPNTVTMSPSASG